MFWAWGLFVWLGSGCGVWWVDCGFVVICVWLISCCYLIIVITGMFKCALLFVGDVFDGFLLLIG